MSFLEIKMEQAQIYLNLAEEAAGDGAHVAYLMHHRTAAELTNSSEALKKILEAAIKYAGRLKKPLDQYATYLWAQREIVTRLPGDPLERIVINEIAKIMQHSK